MATPERRAHLWVSGKVQGVFYRASTAQKAGELGLAGWVRNLPDGRVEALVEGPAAAVEALVRWCWQGPPRARVDDVEVAEEAPTGEFVAFEVRR